MSYKPLGEIMVITKKPKGSMSRKRQLDSASILSCENRLTRMLLFGRTQAVPQLEPNKYSLARKLQASVQVCRPPSRGLRQPETPPRFRTERFVRDSSRQLLLFSVLGVRRWEFLPPPHSFAGSGIVLIPTRARYSSACNKSVPARSMIFSRLSIDETSSSCSVRNHWRKLIVM